MVWGNFLQPLVTASVKRRATVCIGLVTVDPLWTSVACRQHTSKRGFFPCRVLVLSRRFLAKFLWPTLNDKQQASYDFLQQEDSTRKKFGTRLNFFFKAWSEEIDWHNIYGCSSIAHGANQMKCTRMVYVWWELSVQVPNEAILAWNEAPLRKIFSLIMLILNVFCIFLCIILKGLVVLDWNEVAVEL